MPTEFRKMTFSLGELATVIEAYDRSAKKILQNQAVASVEISVRSQPTLIVHCSATGQNGKESFRLDPDYVGAALVWYCINSHIPIPRKGTRSLLISEDGMSLVLQLQSPLSAHGTPLPDFYDYDFFG
jgi:hypothetical protein